MSAIADRLPEIEALRAEGYTDSEIEEELGVRLGPTCKREGCEEPANTRYDRGIFAGLCDPHIEERREEASQTAKEARGSQRAALDAMDRGDAQAVALAGKKIAPRGSRSHMSLDDVHTPPLVGPAKRRSGGPETTSGREVLRPDPAGSESERDLYALLDEYRHEDSQAELELSSRGRNAKPGPQLRALVMSRGGKIKRVAEAMARLRDQEWIKLSPPQRQSYLRLAEYAVSAVELVERDEEMLARGGGRVERF